MAETDENVSQNSVKHSSEKKGVKTPGMLKREKNLVKFTPLTAKQAQEAAARARSLRKQFRARLLDTAIEEGIDKFFAKAIKNQDEDALAIVERAAKLVGLDFASSEESVQKIDLKSDNKNDTKVEIKVKGLGSDD